MPKITGRQFKTVLVIEVILITLMIVLGTSFISITCDGSMRGCMGDQNYSPHRFLILALLRPFFFTPIMVPAMIGGSNFGPILATILTAAATALSALVFYLPGYYLGKKLVRPWLMTNLPSTWSLIRSQDFKLIFITRWVPLFPFDLMSFLFGAANFHASRLVMFSFIGVIPEVWLFSNLASPSNQAIGNGFLQILAFSLITTLPLLAYEYVYRRRGTSLWHQLKRVYYEVFYEVQVNNEIKKKQVFTNQKPPVIILYGFFSSRRTLGVMERLMNVRGYQVMTFNLGGVLGTFFTRGIEETADFIDRKIRRQIQRHGFKKIYIVSHSKGGLVALWWILRMGGHRYCDHVITMGTPFKGSRLTYLALFTPLGFFWKDVWQMRPGSRFLRELHESQPQDNLTIYNIYSERDGVATGTAGVFHHPSNVKLIPMHRYAHFEFLFKRAVADQLVAILNQAEKQRLEQESLQQPMQDRRRPRNGNLSEDDGNQGLA